MNLSELKVCKVKLRQHEAPLQDISGTVLRELAPLKTFLKPGMEIAIAVGSRGVNNIALITQTVAEFIRSCGATPFIVPAMGSHGGATAEGQAELLSNYGVSEDHLGVPVRSSMAVVQIGTTGGQPDIPVFMDRQAWQSDGVIAINRVKVHTDFHGKHESGIVKILTIGLGKHRQAIEMHHYGANGLRDYIPRVSEVVIRSGKILGTLGILEDGYDNTSEIALACGMDIFELDRQYLEKSRLTFAKLPFDRIDVLVVDCMGKNYSGTGLDTNVIGRLCIRGQQDGRPDCGRIVTLDISDESHGNALGVGLSDVITQRLADKINWPVTLENVITSGFLERGFLPIVRQTDQEAIALALTYSGVHTADTVRFARIRNTLDLSEAWLSPALVRELANSDQLDGAADFVPLEFKKDGQLGDF